jgi:toxin ParE1/3/4
MAQILKRETAKCDLIEQWLWYAEQGGIEVADRFLSAAENTLELLFTQPSMGTPVLTRNSQLDGLRRFPVSDGFERILLFYFPLPDAVDLVRVIHGSRDLERLFAEGLTSP